MWALLRPTARQGLEALGSDYGGWVVPVEWIVSGWVCYTAGVGEDTTFDEELGRLGCEVHAIDPTPRAIAHVAAQNFGPWFTMHPVGLWDNPGQQKFFAPVDPAHVSHSIVNLQDTSEFFVAQVTRLDVLMSQLGHSSIDLLKLDIEGAEYRVLAAMRMAGVRPTVVCVEFDQPSPLHEMLLERWRMRRYGYRLVNVDGWNCTWVHAERAGSLSA